MARVQLALNVRDIDASVDFYSKLFGTEPAKVRPGYANFAIADSPVKLVLIEDADQTPGSDQPPRGRGVEHRRGDRGAGRLTAGGLATAFESQTSCCYGVQDKVRGCTRRGGEPWEIYAVLADAEMSGRQLRSDVPGESA